ncbi:integumentary mucin C.1-like isoform X3 [Perca fluviatilis]|uniref:integumentary mucin C.1-like isoform X3 n=1 Tax=Perca fluviatilis TaxID=8168 RepID=UPI001964324D|nr:integumentary mucin C.1-like isoform X3 [Perca fluviatilis]
MALLKAVRYLAVLLVIYYSVEDHSYRESLNLFFEGLMGTKASEIHAREKRQAPLSSTDYVIEIVINTSHLALLEKVLSELPSGINLINNTSVITSVNITTVCSPNLSTYQCRCVENYAWSYNTCIALNACDAIINNTCGCINSLPPDGQYCELNTSQKDVTQCSPPTVTPTTPNTTTRNVTTSNTTQATPTTQEMTTPNATTQNKTTSNTTQATQLVDFDLVLDLRVPVSSVPSHFINIFRQTLSALTFPLFTGSLNITDITFTTGCYPNSTGGLQCQCENKFAWQCSMCNSYGACSNASSQTCQCINGFPDGEFCEPITNVTQCSPPTGMVLLCFAWISSTQSVVVEDTCCKKREHSSKWIVMQIFFFTVTPTTPNTTTRNVTTSNTTQATPTTQEMTTPNATTQNKTTSNTTQATQLVDFDLVLDLRVPVSSVPSHFINIFRQTLSALTFPLFTGSLNIADITFTTGCYPNSTGGLQCQCENKFAWQCSMCNSYGACSNASSQTCECINGLPDGKFCEPITNVTQCSPPTVTTTTPNTTTRNVTTSNTTQATPTTQEMTTPNATTQNKTTSNTTQATPTTSMLNNTTHMATPSTPITANTTSTTQKITTSNTTAAVSNFFTMAIPFEDSYNDPSSSIYQDSMNAIKTQSAKFFSAFNVQLKFR